MSLIKSLLVICFTNSVISQHWYKAPKLVDVPALPTGRDYRPKQWLLNNALDIWYGNKTLSEIISRELYEGLDRLAMREVRSTNTKKKFDIKCYNVPPTKETTSLPETNQTGKELKRKSSIQSTEYQLNDTEKYHANSIPPQPDTSKKNSTKVILSKITNYLRMKP